MAEADDPGRKYLAAVDPVWQKLNAYGWREDCLKQFDQQPMGLVYLLAASICQAEVHNGGFPQFFSNPTGVLGPEALLGFRELKITEWADILSEALKFFGEPYPRDQMERIQLMDKCTEKIGEEWDPFHGLDQRFYAWSAGDCNRWDRLADQYAMEFLKRNSIH